MSKSIYNSAVRSADDAVASWCLANGVQLHGIEHVITWEDWDDGIGVYFFLRQDADLRKLKTPQADEMKRVYLDCLKESGYPFDEFPNVVFEIDSDENVRKNYAGSYFYRLR